MLARAHKTDRAQYFGLDLTAGRRASGFATLDVDGALVDVGLLGSDDDIIARVAASGATTVAIDCPLSLPAGLCCLDASCDCRPANREGTRACERAVSARGYAIYYTTKRTFIRSMTERGIALAARLRTMGLEVIEVYPYATKAALFGKEMPRKTSALGREWLMQRVAPLVPGLAATSQRRTKKRELRAEARENTGHGGECGLSHDELDAVVCAYTALLFDRGGATALGDVAEGTIVAPLRAEPRTKNLELGRFTAKARRGAKVRE